MVEGMREASRQQTTDDSLMEEWRAAVREFCSREIAPRVEAAERDEAFPVELFSIAGQMGYLCVRLSSEHGGQGMSKVAECILAEELMYENRGIGTSLFAHSHLGTYPIAMFGTTEQRERFLRPATAGRKIAAFSLTEPGAGSDVRGIATRAVRRGGGWVLNGSKMYTTNGTIADYAIVAAYVDKDKGYNGIGLFIVETGSEGFKAVKLHKEGSRSSNTAQIFLDDCYVPDDRTLTSEGGFLRLMATLDEGRVTIAAGALGLARRAFDAALAYARERHAFGQPIGRFQVISHKLATMMTEIEAARCMTYEAARRVDAGLPITMQASMAKVFASEVCMRVTLEARHIFGGAGELPESLVGRFLRDAQNLVVGEGTSEIQRNIIARELGL
jgi:butyryl-CoA dehydrogenase